ncbi:MAG: FAD-dependent oxidoreductase [Candidatus Marinimicrobia bacterium]|nr:FAD-dependent oxidoreductase [Candidatus Neomarinimicrobiota bacterium]
MTKGKSKLTTGFLVIGGGAGGVCAAIEAARRNILVILAEETEWLGGMLSAAGVSCIDGNYAMQSGLFGEFAEKIFQFYGGTEKVKTGWVSHINFEPSVANKIIHELMENLPTLTVLKKHKFQSIKLENNSIQSVILENENGHEIEISAKVYMDATDYGDVAFAAECDYNEGTSETGQDQNIQDITWVAILQEFENGIDHLISKPDNYNADDFLGCCQEWSNDEFPSQLSAEKMLEYGKLPNNKYMINWPIRGNDFFTNVLDLSPEEREKEWAKAREFSLCKVYFIQNKLGYKNLGLAQEFFTEHGLALIPYNRESRRFKGYAKFDVDHILEPYKYDLYKKGIAVGDYPVDHHHSRNSEKIDEEFPKIPSFNVPYDVLVSQDLDNLLLGEKNISVSHYMNGSTRLQPVVMQLGQAAGAAASLAILQNKKVAALNIRQLQITLLESGVYIAPVYDINKDSEYFSAVQRVCVAGMMKLDGIPHQWANRSFFYPEKVVTLEDVEFLIRSFLGKMVINLGNFDKDDVLDLNQIHELLKMNGIQDFQTIEENKNTLTRKQFAVILDEALKPFAKELYLTEKLNEMKE